MKKILLTTVALVALTASAASAQINARWTDCGGVSAVTSTCTLLSPVRSLILSWVAPSAGASTVVGYDIKVTYATPAAPKSCWWDFNPAGPRAAGFGLAGTDNPVSCPNFLGAFGSPNTAGGYQDLGGNLGRFNIAVANAAGQGADATAFAGTELYAATIQIKTAGTGAGCLGCADGVQIRLNDISLANEVGPALDINTPGTANGNCGTWQAGVCDAATPTKNATWGSVKTLYR